ncbi:lamin tail domain-containing protein [Wenjunlia tyrosinilytica]|uniref:LTD domain-containing protein n=1 Tax=Wenjunlia tyrosinilytica TaxID=1544741 RepID=A0A917ZPD3_9ACTN|nr:lamin tail domain-containing protein [Wenjunlia tyrosinilytica]GGO87862.1 hypothetical protein GCM10012280_27310 [Wenjunlia tyrosinilytica]
MRVRCAMAAAVTVAALSAAGPADAAEQRIAPGRLGFTFFQFDALGADDSTNASINGEYLRLTNTTDLPRQLSGWTIPDPTSAGQDFAFPSFVLAPGRSVTIHSGRGTGTSTDLYWGRGRHVWDNESGFAFLWDQDSRTRDVCDYDSDFDPGWAGC